MIGKYIRTEVHRERIRQLGLSQKGINSPSYGRKHTKKEKEKMRNNHGIRKTYFKKGRTVFKEIRDKIGNGNRGKIVSLQTRRKISNSLKGEKNPNWKGGITPLRKVIKGSIEYKLWRSSVFKRDNYTCVWCGSKEKIEADHIKKFSDYPELRFSIDNGRTLCHGCHVTTDTYRTKRPKIS